MDSIINPLSIYAGHGECRSLDETVPVLSHITGLCLVNRDEGNAVLKHPNTDWLLILHEGGPELPDKAERHHYGVRVADNANVDAAYQYLLAEKDQLGLKKVVKRRERDGSYSMFFVEPGGNYWEIESYENRHKAGLPFHVAFPWKQLLTEEQFPGRGYIPQAFTHGTIECTDLMASVKFYQQGLGLSVISHVPTIVPHDIQHPDHPWYVVSLQVPEKNRHFQRRDERFTIAVQSASQVADAHRQFSDRRDQFGLSEIGAISNDGRSFILADRDRNWWEITCPE